MKKFKRISFFLLSVVLFLFAFSACTNSLPPVIQTPSGHVHSLSFVAKKSSSYAEHGNKAYYRCDCGAYFLEGREEKAEWKDIVIPSSTGFDKRQYVNDGYTLNYCIYEPLSLDKTKDKLPFILFLHGAGERGDDNQSQLKNAILQVIGKDKGDSAWQRSVVIAPQCPSGGLNAMDDGNPNKWVQTSWASGNYEQKNVAESQPLKAAASLIKLYANEEYIDEKRVYVVGLSMGGFGTWDILSRYPGLFAAGVPICGGAPTDRVDVLKNIPVYTFHDKTDSTVPYSGTSEIYDKITSSGGKKILFYSFNNEGGHAVWDKAIAFSGKGDYPALEEWLFSKSK